MELILSLIMGAIGGNGAGGILKKFSLGTLWNSIVGILGGAGGQGIMGAIGALTGNAYADAGIGGVAGGGILLTVIGLIKKVMGSK